MSSSPRLPNELSDQVIQNLRDDPKSLANCALVCLAWVPASQRSLFFKLTIHERNCRQIVEHISSTSSRISGYVKRLSIFLWGDLRENMKLRFSPDKTPLLDLFLPHTSLFNNVADLELDGVRAFSDKNWDVAWTDPLASAFPALTTLRVGWLTFEDLPHLVELVSSFSQLTCLIVDDIDIAEASHEYTNEDQEPYDGPRTPPPQLKNIKYSSGTSFASGGGPFIRWLATGNPTFSTLYLDLDAEAGDVTAGVELIKASGSNLRELFLTFSDQWHLWEDMELSDNSNLQTLVLPSVGDFGEEIVRILQSIKSPIEHLTLGDLYQVERELWLRIVEVLMLPSFSSLKEANFTVASGTSEYLETEITDANPEFFQRGIAIFERKETHEFKNMYELLI